MTENDVTRWSANIRATASSPLDMQGRMIELLCKCIVAPKQPQDRYLGDIAAFHEKFGLPYTGGPRLMTTEMANFRIKFLQEELDEFREGVAHNDLEKQFDALIDLVYVALGTAYLQGFPFEEGWRRVQTANMAKERATKASASKRGTTLDIVKPSGWTPPSLTDLIGQIP